MGTQSWIYKDTSINLVFVLVMNEEDDTRWYQFGKTKKIFVLYIFDLSSWYQSYKYYEKRMTIMFFYETVTK